MNEFKKPFQQLLFKSFLLGSTVAAAAKEAGVSVPTARAFRDKYSKELKEQQLRSCEGVLEQLKEMLPDAVARLKYWLNPPAISQPLPCDCASQPHTIECASLKIANPFINHGADLKTIRAIFDIYDLMRNVDFEKRLKALEKVQAEAAKEAAKDAKVEVEEGSK